MTHSRWHSPSFSSPCLACFHHSDEECRHQGYTAGVYLGWASSWKRGLGGPQFASLNRVAERGNLSFFMVEAIAWEVIFPVHGVRCSPYGFVFLGVPVTLRTDPLSCSGWWHRLDGWFWCLSGTTWKDFYHLWMSKTMESRKHPFRALKKQARRGKESLSVWRPQILSFIWKCIIVHHKCFIIASWIIHLQLNNLKFYRIMFLWKKNITNLGPSCEEKVLTLSIYFPYAVEDFFVTMKYGILIKEQIKN